jgi:hypothetical protein
MRRLCLTPLATALALGVLAAPAPAFEQFAGVTERGSLVTFTSQNPYALSRPRAIQGLAAGERLVALGRGARGVVAVGTSARLYALDVAAAQATPIGPAFAQGLRGARFSLAVAPGANRARLLSDVGQDLVVDLATGATADGPELRRERDGAPVRPAADMTPDGSIVGVQINPDELLRELARGTASMAQLPFAAPRGVPLGEPLAFQLGSDGTAYVVAVASARLRDRQSVLTMIDPSTGERAGPLSRSVQFFGRRIATFAALGRVARDRTPPHLQVAVPRRIRASTLFNRRIPVVARTKEAAQVTVSLRVAGREAGFTFETRDTPGHFLFRTFSLTKAEIGRILRGIGGPVRVVFRANDLKGNHRTVVRTARLTR